MMENKRENAPGPYEQRNSNLPGALAATAQPAAWRAATRRQLRGSALRASYPIAGRGLSCLGSASQHRAKLFLMLCPSRFHKEGQTREGTPQKNAAWSSLLHFIKVQSCRHKKRPVQFQHKAVFITFRAFSAKSNRSIFVKITKSLEVVWPQGFHRWWNKVI